MALSFTEGCEVRHGPWRGWEKNQIIKTTPAILKSNHASEASWRDSSLWNGLIRAPARGRPTHKKMTGIFQLCQNASTRTTSSIFQLQHSQRNPRNDPAFF
jgi:hypothetical protein